MLSGFFPENAGVKVSGPVDIDILKTTGSDWQLAVSQLKLDLPNFPETRIQAFKASVGNKTGTIVETSMSFPRRKMPQKGKYTFIIEQGITKQEIDEVLDLTLRVEEAKED